MKAELRLLRSYIPLDTFLRDVLYGLGLPCVKCTSSSCKVVKSLMFHIKVRRVESLIYLVIALRIFKGTIALQISWNKLE